MEPKSTTTITGFEGHEWRVGLRKSYGTSVFFTTGWRNVVKDVHLCDTDIMMFKEFPEDSRFDLVVYAKNGFKVSTTLV